MFKTVWDVGPPQYSVKILTKGSFSIDWGDGCVERINGDRELSKPGKIPGYHYLLHDIEHYYPDAGRYTISIDGDITQFKTRPDTSDCLIDVLQWGPARWESMMCMFSCASNLQISASDTPDLSRVSDMRYMFHACYKFNSPIEHWDVSGVVDMSGILHSAESFNRSINKMDLRSLRKTDDMLYRAYLFDQDLRDLNIGADTDTSGMFCQSNAGNVSLDDYLDSRREVEQAHEDAQWFSSVLGAPQKGG